MAGLCLPGSSGIECSLIYILWILIFFVGAILRKQINDNMNTSFSLIGATVAGIVLQVVVFYIPFIGGLKLSVLGAIIGIILGGFGGGMLGLPDTESSGD